jgi:hypothetical protein
MPRHFALQEPISGKPIGSLTTVEDMEPGEVARRFLHLDRVQVEVVTAAPPPAPARPAPKPPKGKQR